MKLCQTDQKVLTMHNMKLIFLSLVIVFVASCSVEPVDVVKEGTLNFDESVTIGAALDGYKYFEKSTWETFETSQGRTIVEFTGVMAQNAYVGSTLEGVRLTEEILTRSNVIMKDLKFTYSCQFQISEEDDTFEVVYSGINFSGDDTIANEHLDDNVKDDDFSILKRLYNNEPDENTLVFLIAIAAAY